MSSTAVYRPWSDGVMDETFPRVSDGTGDSYFETKLESEELALEYHREKKLPVVVIHPVAIYGPGAAAWTVRIINRLKENSIILVNGDTSFHNFAYVDDIARGMILAAEAENVEGETFIMGGSEKIIINDFYAAFENMLGIHSVVSVSSEELESAGEDLKAVVRNHGLSGDKPVIAIASLDARTYFSSEKARQRLGYEPQVNFESGIKLTEEWARRTGLLEA